MKLAKPAITHEEIFVHALLPADFNETLPTQTVQCPSKHPKMVQIFVASFSVYQCFITTL